jgi:hypothetical protein
MTARAYIPYPERLAAALLARGEIPYLDAKLLTAEQLNSLYQFHHNIRHAEDGSDHFSNLEPMLIATHRERTRKIDVPAIAKGKRLTLKHEEFRRRLLAKDAGIARPPSRWPRRKMQGRRT